MGGNGLHMHCFHLYVMIPHHTIGFCLDTQEMEIMKGTNNINAIVSLLMNVCLPFLIRSPLISYVSISFNCVSWPIRDYGLNQPEKR